MKFCKSNWTDCTIGISSQFSDDTQFKVESTGKTPNTLFKGENGERVNDFLTLVNGLKRKGRARRTQQPTKVARLDSLLWWKKEAKRSRSRRHLAAGMRKEGRPMASTLSLSLRLLFSSSLFSLLFIDACVPFSLLRLPYPLLSSSSSSPLPARTGNRYNNVVVACSRTT